MQVGTKLLDCYDKKRDTRLNHQYKQALTNETNNKGLEKYRKNVHAIKTNKKLILKLTAASLLLFVLKPSADLLPR